MARLIKLTEKQQKQRKSPPYHDSEKKFMNIMEARGIELVPYPQRFFVMDGGKPCFYTPDFLEKGTNRYYEVTNQHHCYKRNKSKYDSFRKINPGLQLINVTPDGEPYIPKGEKKQKEYKPKTIYLKKRDFVVEI